MTKESGRRTRLPIERIAVCDFLTVAKNMPIVPVEMSLALPELPQLLRESNPRIAWTVVLLKAWSLVVWRQPTLRQLYLGLPWPHLFQHECTDGTIAVERHFQGRRMLFPARFKRPHERSLEDLQQEYDHYVNAPLAQIGRFRRHLFYSRIPSLLRLPLVWTIMNLLPARRVAKCGAFGMSMCITNIGKPTVLFSPMTTGVGYGRLLRDGTAEMLYTFDHRILDGLELIDIRRELEFAFSSDITSELRELVSHDGDRSFHDDAMWSDEEAPAENEEAQPDVIPLFSRRVA